VPSAEPTIESEAVIPAPVEEVFEFLSDLRNHWQLTAHSIHVVELDAGRDGGLVRIRGPLGVGRTAHTHVTARRSPRLIIGTAELRSGTRARVSWTLAGRMRTTRVRLAADVEHASLPDRVLLALGGRAYMDGVFSRTLERLAAHFTTESQSEVPAPNPAP
jgi:uncharacterized protein YndB with AHSA1/START domain